MQKSLKLFFAIAAVSSLLCVVWLLLIPSDPKTAWLLGYSRSRWLLLAVSAAGTFFFSGLLYQFRRDAGWLKRIAKELDCLLSNDYWGTLVLGIATSLFLFTVTLLSVTYVQFGHSIDLTYRSTVVLTQVYLSRLFPILVWVAWTSLVCLVMLVKLGYTDRIRWFRVFSILLFVYFTVVFLVVDALNRLFIRKFTSEDNFVEWLTVACMVAASLLALIHAAQTRRTNSPYFWFFVLFGIACVVFALEEISWGQRIFGIETTEFFVANSDQQEINVHNVVNEWFSIRTKHVAAWVMFIYGVILPLLAFRPRIRQFFERLRILLPPLILSIGVILSGFLTSDRFFAGQEEELAELFLSFFLVLFMIWEFLQPSWTEDRTQLRNKPSSIMPSHSV